MCIYMYTCIVRGFMGGISKGEPTHHPLIANPPAHFPTYPNTYPNVATFKNKVHFDHAPASVILYVKSSKKTILCLVWPENTRKS